MTVLYLSAKHLEFYYDRFLIEADGNVRVRTSDGFTVTGDAFTMDLKLNRFMVAGHVMLHDKTGQVKEFALATINKVNESRTSITLEVTNADSGREALVDALQTVARRVANC